MNNAAGYPSEKTAAQTRPPKKFELFADAINRTNHIADQYRMLLEEVRGNKPVERPVCEQPSCTAEVLQLGPAHIQQICDDLQSTLQELRELLL